MVRIRRKDAFEGINGESIVRYKKTGHVSEILYMSTKSTIQIKKLNKDEYVILKSGLILNFKHNENRADDMKSIARSLAQGRDMINSNVDDPKNCRWVTLTYAENMTDPKRLWIDAKTFIRDCRKRYGQFEYITAAEPQGRGAWHLHMLMIFDHKAPFMKNEDIANYWGQGFVTVKKLDDVDNVGAYLTAYLGDVAIDEYEGSMDGIKGIKTVEVNGKEKKFVKGGRLHMYPPGMHIFRWSRGVKKPEVERIKYKKAKEKVGTAIPTYTETKTLTDDKSGFESILSREYYNTRRISGQRSNIADGNGARRVSEDEPPAAAMSSSVAIPI